MNIEEIEVKITRKKIKNINLRAYPDGSIKLSAPFTLPEHKIYSFLKSKSSWIKKQQSRFPKKLKYLPGENHYFLGKKYKLNIVLTENSTGARINGENLDLYVKPKSDKEKILFEFYKLELEKRVPLLIKKWEKIIGKEVKDFKIRRMKTRWGSCNFKKRKISINSELAKRPVYFLEYVVVHEMVHLIEKSHNKNFKNLMTLFLPEWKKYKEDLKTAI